MPLFSLAVWFVNIVLVNPVVAYKCSNTMTPSERAQDHAFRTLLYKSARSVIFKTKKALDIIHPRVFYTKVPLYVNLDGRFVNWLA